MSCNVAATFLATACPQEVAITMTSVYMLKFNCSKYKLGTSQKGLISSRFVGGNLPGISTILISQPTNLLVYTATVPQLCWLFLWLGCWIQAVLMKHAWATLWNFLSYPGLGVTTNSWGLRGTLLILVAHLRSFRFHPGRATLGPCARWFSGCGCLPTSVWFVKFRNSNRGLA